MDWMLMPRDGSDTEWGPNGVAPSHLVMELAAKLSDLIRVGDLAVGDKLVTQKLANRFGVSRSPVREALSVLGSTGLVEQRPNRGFFVRDDAPPATVPVSELLPRESRSEYRRIAEDWLSDRIPAEVTEQMLRERYGLTRAQVTSVLVRATREGWAERKQGYGWRFLPVAKTPEAFAQIYRFRMILEPAALMEPTFHLDRDILVEQRRIQQRMLESDIQRLPAEQLIENGSTFHEELVRMSGNAFMHMTLVRLNRMRRLLEYRSTIDRERLCIQCSEHIRILDALEANDPIEASYLLKRHLGGALARKGRSAGVRDESVQRSG